jgi:hypothetical protein
MLDKESKANTLLLLWRAWLLRNDIMHGDGLATVLGSAEFLRSYSILLSDIGHTTGGGATRGKVKCKKVAGVGVTLMIRRGLHQNGQSRWRAG